MKSKMWLLRLVPRLLVTAVLLAGVVMPILPPQKEAKAAPSYPVLPAGLNYYQTIFPAGLVYSDGWYGTFTNAPKAQAILLFDDDYLPTWGRAIFAMSPAPQKQPSGAQGGTNITAITRDQANVIIQSYALSNFAPIDPEILQVMPRELHFAGVWAGDKLAQKWSADIPPPSNLTQKQQDYLATTSSVINIKRAQTEKAIRDFDPPRYWVPNTVSGNWSNTVMWANASGNMSGGASVPTNVDNTFFDINSFNSANKTVTVNVAANTLNMDWTGATNTPTFAGTQTVSISGNLTTILNMVWTESGALVSLGDLTLTSNGLNLSSIPYIQANSLTSLILADDLTTTRLAIGGTLNTNGKTVNLSNRLDFPFGFSPILTMGASVINTTVFDAATGGASLTITPNTATINISGTGALAGGSYNYNGATFNLNGTAHTISGNNTFASFSGSSTKAQTITFTDGSSQTATTLNLSGSSGFQHTLQGSGVAGWSINQTAGTVTADYITISRSTGVTTNGAVYNAVGGSVNGGNNVNWNFPLTIATGASSGVSYDKNGVVSGNFTGTITDMGGSATVGAWFDYGLTIAYGSTTANTTYSTTNFTGTKTRALPTTLTPGQTYNFRRAITSGANTTYGTNASFTLTMPSVTTGAATDIGTPSGVPTATLHGTVPTFGVASSAYAGIRWWTDPAAKTDTETSVLGAGAYSVIITNYDRTLPVSYQSYVRVGSVYVLGATQTFTESSESSFNLLRALLTLILAAGIVMWCVRNGVTIASLGGIIVGLIAIAIVNGIIG